MPLTLSFLWVGLLHCVWIMCTWWGSHKGDSVTVCGLIYYAIVIFQHVEQTAILVRPMVLDCVMLANVRLDTPWLAPQRVVLVNKFVCQIYLLKCLVIFSDFIYSSLSSAWMILILRVNHVTYWNKRASHKTRKHMDKESQGHRCKETHGQGVTGIY